MKGEEDHRLWNLPGLVSIPSNVDLELINFGKPQSSHLRNRDNIFYLTGLLLGFKK